MRGRSRIRLLSAIAVVATFVAGSAVSVTGSTEAMFTDSEYTRATFTGAKLAPPQITSVHHCSGLLGLGLANGVTLDWTWSGGDPYSTFTPATNAQWAYNSAGNNWQAVATTTLSPGVYRTTFNTGVVTDLLSLLFGGAMTFQVRTKVGDNWVSSGVSKVVFHSLGGGALGAFPYCETPVNGS